MKKVVYISMMPLTKHIAKNFFVRDLMRNGIPVEYWDIGGLYFHNRDVIDVMDLDIVVKINDRDEVERRIAWEDVNHTVFVSIVNYRWDTIWLHRLYTKNSCHTVFFERGALPFPNQINNAVRIVKRLMAGEVGNLWKGLLNRSASYLNTLGVVEKCDVVFAAGREATERHKGASRIIGVNHFDYDHFLSLRVDSKRLVRGRYAVFLDENTPYHPDWNVLKMRTVNPDSYFQGINRFFDMVEKKWNVNVIIAAHPTSDYKQSIYQGRKMFKYKTNELVRDCDFVLSHMSTSISFAVLHEKPILSLYNNDMEVCGPDWLVPFIANLSRILGGEVYNVDKIQDTEQIKLPLVNLTKYEEYKYKYLTAPESEGRLTKDIFLEFLAEEMPKHEVPAGGDMVR